MAKGKGLTPPGDLDAADIFTNETLQTVWEDMASDVPVQDTADKVGLSRVQVSNLRGKIRTAIRNDPEFKKKARAKIDELTPLFRDSVRRNLKAGDPSVTNAFGKGRGLYVDDHDPGQISDNQDTNAIIRRLCEIIASVPLPKP